MTTTSDVISSAPAPIQLGRAPDRRGSWIPTGGMITTRFMELRKRRGLMVALIFVTIVIPAVFLVIRLLTHAIAPKSYGPAGGEAIFNALVAGVIYVFGFIVAATLGCTAGSIDLTEGMFRHLVVTGRSRLALYLARIPAGLAIVVPLVAIGFTLVCAVCVFAAPTQVNYQGVGRARRTVRDRSAALGFRPPGPGDLRLRLPGGLPCRHQRPQLRRRPVQRPRRWSRDHQRRPSRFDTRLRRRPRP